MQKNLFILFGATGDLSRVKLFQALLALYKKNPNNLTVLAVSRRPYTDDDFRNFIHEYIDGDSVTEFLSNVQYVSGTFDEKETYRKVKYFIDTYDFQNISAYLAVSPEYFETIIEQGYGAGLWKTGAHTHVLIEKPYAHTVTKFDSLMRVVDRCLGDNAFLVDHYLGKAPMRDVLNFQKEHKVCEDVLKNGDSKKIELTLFENNDVEKRGAYYDVVGAFVDVGANHMLQMLIAPFVSGHDASRVSGEKVAILESLSIDAERSKKFQYEGYKEIEHVKENSKTETAFEVYLTSNHLLLKNTEIVLIGGKGFDRYKNELTIKDVQGNVSFGMSLKPEQYLVCGDEKKTFDNAPDAYEVIIEKSFTEDSICFVTREEVRTEWRIISDLQDIWEGQIPETYTKNIKPFI